MEREFLRDEFLRLSGVYPELRHALVIGNDNDWLSVRPLPGDVRLFGRDSLKYVLSYALNSDQFAYVYCLWQGCDEYDRPTEAEAEFHRLAQIAARSVNLKAFPERKRGQNDFLNPF